MRDLYRCVEDYLGEKKRSLEVQRRIYFSGVSSINGFGRKANVLLEEIHLAQSDLDLLNSGNVSRDYLDLMKKRYNFE